MLRRFLKALAVGAALVSTSATAAVPLQMNVQGSLLNADGTPVSGTYSIVFTLYDGSAANAATVWSETIADVAASAGVFDEVLGSGGTPLAASVFTGTNQLWLGIKILSGPGVPNGGQAELPRRPLATVAYAFESGHAVSAATADNLTCTGCVALSKPSWTTRSTRSRRSRRPARWTCSAPGASPRVSWASTWPPRPSSTPPAPPLRPP